MDIKITPELNIQGCYGTKNIQTKYAEKPSFVSYRPNIDTSEIKNITAQLPEIFDSISGIYSINDISKIIKMKKVFSSMNKEELQNLFLTAEQSYINNYSKRLDIIKNDKDENLYVFNKSNLTNNCQRDLKNDKLCLAAMKQVLFEEYPEILETPYRKWFDCDIEYPSTRPAQTLYEHPCDKILRLTGTLNTNDFTDINKLLKYYEKKPVLEIIKEKIHILNNMQKYLAGKNSDLIGQFTDKEYTDMKNLAKKYYALNKIQTSYGYFSKSIESILYSEMQNLKPGKYVDGIGFITDENNIDDRNIIIALLYKDNRYMFRMFDKDILEEKNTFLKTLPKKIPPESINEINQRAKAIIDKEKNSLISEIHFEIINKQETKHFLKNHNESEDYADIIMGENKYSYIIKGFRNYYKEQCGSAGKCIGIRLLKFLKNADAKPIFLSARATVGNHSPVSMYLHIGFKPLSKTECEVYNSIEKNRYNSKYRLTMYAPNFEIFGEKIDKLYDFYFPNSENSVKQNCKK